MDKLILNFENCTVKWRTGNRTISEYCYDLYEKQSAILAILDCKTVNLVFENDEEEKQQQILRERFEEGIEIEDDIISEEQKETDKKNNED